MVESNETSSDVGDVGESNPARGPIEPSGASLPLPPPPSYYSPPPLSKGRGVAGRLFVSILTALLLFSIVLNGYLWMFFNTVTSGPWEATYGDGQKDQRIIIVPIKGIINADTAAFMHTVTRQLREDRPEAIRAIVLRVDSGGGGVGASDRIYHALQQLKNDERTAHIKIVASFGGVAASGGYYISVPADFIMAEPTTLTGSIGVLAPFFEIKDLLDHIGITPEVLKASDSPKKDIGSYMRKWEPKDRKRFTELIDDAHARFKQIVQEGRAEKLTSPISAVADGDVFTAAEAHSHGLVDAIGYLDDAINKAKELAEIDPAVQPKVTVIRPPYSMSITSFLDGHLDTQTMLSPELLRQWILELSSPRLAYRMWP